MSKRGVPKLGIANARGDHLVHVKVGARCWVLLTRRPPPRISQDGCAVQATCQGLLTPCLKRCTPPPFCNAAGQDPQDDRRRGAQAHGAAARAADVQAGGQWAGLVLNGGIAAHAAQALAAACSSSARMRQPPCSAPLIAYVTCAESWGRDANRSSAAVGCALGLRSATAAARRGCMDIPPRSRCFVTHVSYAPGASRRPHDGRYRTGQSNKRRRIRVAADAGSKLAWRQCGIH